MLKCESLKYFKVKADEYERIPAVSLCQARNI